MDRTSMGVNSTGTVGSVRRVVGALYRQVSKLENSSSSIFGEPHKFLFCPMIVVVSESADCGCFPCGSCGNSGLLAHNALSEPGFRRIFISGPDKEALFDSWARLRLAVLPFILLYVIYFFGLVSLPEAASLSFCKGIPLPLSQ
ncbi:hypothetical protein L873DRAFT_1315033 [Choiromyces venosus 120613-1]|uniref:Uncharacterized protein n=1 Tax=Choiromyces venosus 120613-1 TaxID=1336337 RepID=A0A3N4JFM9_9PEZI|nr:hypothetical protein L873DRAFT_1315033 [Choiromyces venosus 120613-1]